jgi:hypothetical protein
MSEDALHMWTVYDHPRDYPDHYVARRFEVRGGVAAATNEAYLAHQLYPLREAMLSMGLTALPRMENDDPCIIETWL